MGEWGEETGRSDPRGSVSAYDFGDLLHGQTGVGQVAHEAFEVVRADGLGRAIGSGVDTVEDHVHPGGVLLALGQGPRDLDLSGVAAAVENAQPEGVAGGNGLLGDVDVRTESK